VGTARVAWKPAWCVEGLQRRGSLAQRVELPQIPTPNSLCSCVLWFDFQILYNLNLRCSCSCGDLSFDH
jgi:hypothetical protein